MTISEVNDILQENIKLRELIVRQQTLHDELIIMCKDITYKNVALHNQLGKLLEAYNYMYGILIGRYPPKKKTQEDKPS